MSKSHMQHLTDELGDAIGLPDLALDEKDFVCIVSEDGVVLNLDYFEDEDTLVMYTTVGEIPDDKRLKLYQEMLRANFFWETTAGATLCLDPEIDLALLMANVTVADMSLPQLMNILDHFTKLAWAWSDRIRALIGEQQDAAERPVQAEQAPGMFDPSRLA
ncbi:MAG: type III secretion system chaperone [Candidatus Competibacteraceae bacterium]|nr:type III secretion system chaperone [Candidatus Competibacteraceae bacterium]